mgnify:CR=1 FL=1
MDWDLILNEAAIGSLKSIVKIAYIVIPLMILMELAREAKLLDKMVTPLKPLTKFIGLSPAATFPLIVGTIFGLAYGAGLIIEYVEQGLLSKEENYLLNVFLSICHALVEDTLLFLVIGANFGVIVGVRVVVAILLTRLFAYLLSRRTLYRQVS